ncbi:MAG: hypothetical protein U5K84_02810 [Alkalibacterium sp.]|nr:hypothetical protein [Alkalibacterium sp.]
MNLKIARGEITVFIGGKRMRKVHTFAVDRPFDQAEDWHDPPGR